MQQLVCSCLQRLDIGVATKIDDLLLANRARMICFHVAGWWYQIRSSSSAQLSEPPRVALTGIENLSLNEALKDLSPTPATETAAPRTRTSDASVIMAAGEDILIFGGPWIGVLSWRCGGAS